MPYMLQPKNYTQIARPNLYNVAYRRVGAYKGMGRLHPANYLEIGSRPNRIGATAGQYNTLSGQSTLLPPSLRGLGRGIPVWSWRPRFWRRGLGQTTATDMFLGLPTQSVINTPNAPFEYTLQDVPQSINPNTGQVFWTGTTTTDPNTLLLVAGGALLLILMARR